MPDYVTRQAVREMQAIATAQADVAPVVGALPAMDTAAGIYTEALKRMGVTPKDVRAVSGTTAGAKAMFQIVRDRCRSIGRASVAMDSAADHDRRKAMFPNWERLK